MDKIFREKLEAHSVEPPSHLWDGIQGQMAALRRKRRIAFISRIAAAAVVLLAFLAGWYFNEKSESLIPEITQSRLTDKKTEQAGKPEGQSDQQIELKEKNSAGPGESVITVEKTETQKQGETLVASTPVADEKVMEVKVNRLPERIRLERLDYLETNLRGNNYITGNLRKKTGKKSDISVTEGVLIAANIRSIAEIKDKEVGWKLGLNIAPGYSSHTSNYTNGYAQNMTYAGSGGEANVSGGISVQYKTKSRWSIESGVYYAQNTQASSNSPQLVAFEAEGSGFDQMNSPNAGERYYFNTSLQVADNMAIMNSSAGIIEFKELPKGAEIAASPESGTPLGFADSYASSLLTSGEFSQVFDFMEVPLYLRYLLLDSKFDIELIGGFNAGLVVGNNVIMKNENSSQNIGETKDISSLNMSGTLGFGVNYALGKHISLGVEPRISYYLNSINNNPAVDYRPYRIGIYTGLYYEF